MLIWNIKKRIVFSFLAVIILLGLCIALFSFSAINKHILERAQEEVNNDLKTVRLQYDQQLTLMRTAFTLAQDSESLDSIQDVLELDYIFRVAAQELGSIESEIVRASIDRKRGIGGTRIISVEELARINPEFPGRYRIVIQPTPKARPTTKTELTSVISMEYAKPVLNKNQEVVSVIYGGKILNKNVTFLGEITGSMFEDRLYAGKPLGTVTIFQDDVRVATNVLNGHNHRAVGTRVSDTVYTKVVEQGGRWNARAFVVTDWYLTAYEPIKNIHDQVIGMLYIGIFERPFIDLRNHLFLSLLGIIILGSLVATVVAWMLSISLAKPLLAVVKAANTIREGNLADKVPVDTSVQELNSLASSFNAMAVSLAEREKHLSESNRKLSELNTSYLDLISFVAHELKGILASTVLNAYAVRDGFLGMVNFKQRKALDSVAKNLDYLDATVKNFLNLSRVEKNELSLKKTKIALKDVFDDAIEAFQKQADEKQMRIENTVDVNIKLSADPDLFKIVANNFISNAIKYGSAGGAIILSARQYNGTVRIEVYNDGVPLSDTERAQLFRRFSRVNNEASRRQKGTGLGLFISKEIIERHNGKLWVEPRSGGNAFIFEVQREE